MSTSTTKPKKKRRTQREMHEARRVGPVMALPEGKLWEVVIIKDGQESVARPCEESQYAASYMNSYNYHGLDTERGYAFAREVRTVRVRGGRVVRPVAAKGGAA